MSSIVRKSAVVFLALAFYLGSPVAASAAWHVVQPGETLWLIGQAYGIDASAIAEANAIADADLIQVGEELWIPVGDEGEVAPEELAIIHVVVAGDTVAGIAATYGVDALELATENGIESPYLIFPGQEITVVVPSTGPEPGAPAPQPPGNIDPEIPFIDRETVRATVIEVAQAWGWDPYLILSLAWRESTWDQRALSPAGAVGVMQLMPTTAEWAGPALVGRQTDYAFNVYDNVETGVAYLSHLRALTGSDYLALASYFQGSASVERDGIFPVTREYALGIIQSRDLFATGALP